MTIKTSAYLVLADGWVGGVFLRRDDVVQLTPAQAQFENVAPAPEPAEKPAIKSARSRVRKSASAQ